MILVLGAVYYCYNAKHFFTAVWVECLVSPGELPPCWAQAARRRCCSAGALSGEQSDGTAPAEQGEKSDNQAVPKLNSNIKDFIFSFKI